MQTPPIAPQRPHRHIEHGVVRDDPFQWLRDRDDPAVLAYIEAENEWTEQRMAPLRDLRGALYEEMLGRVQETDAYTPVPHGPWHYYSRTEDGKAYEIHCRRAADGGDEQVILDVNVLARGHDFIEVAAVSHSPDHGVLAYAIDVTGREIFEIRFVSLDGRPAVPDVLCNASPGVAWASDSRTVLWHDLDDKLRSWRVLRRTLGQEAPDAVVLEEPDDRFRVMVGRLRSGAYLVVASVSAMATEWSLIPADDPAAAPRCLQTRQRHHRYRFDHTCDALWIISDDCVGPDGDQLDGALNGRLLRAPVSATSKADWEEVIPHRAEVELVDVDAFANHLVITEREDGQLRLRVRDLRSGAEHVVAMPEPVCVVDVAANLDFDTPWLRFSYRSMTTPASIFRVNMDTGERQLVKRTPVPGYDPAGYRSERRAARGADGAEVPMTLVYAHDVELTPDTPMLVYGYGSYGLTVDPVFNQKRVSLLDRGVVYVIAHVRGGGFLGRGWYEAGKLEHKHNTFDDFIAVTESLHAAGVSSPARTVLSGGSAGGLLMGAVVNQAPQICVAALAAVPFVDVVTTMLDASMPLTAGEWDEWGDPREPEAFRRMLGYSPYDNVAAQAYPDLLVISGLNDPRVQYWEPTKWVARLRATATGGDLMLLTHMGAGHAGRSGRYGGLEDRAFEDAWVLDRLGLTAAG